MLSYLRAASIGSRSLLANHQGTAMIARHFGTSTRLLAEEKVKRTPRRKPKATADPKEEKDAPKVKGRPKKIYDKSNLPPKRPTPGFFQFVNLKYNDPSLDHLGKDLVARTKELGAQWRAFTQEEKDKYQPTAAEIAEYQEKRKEWELTIDPVVLAAINADRVKKGKFKFRTRSVKPRGTTGYRLFMAEWRSNNGDLDPGTSMKEGSKAWRALAEAEQQVYKDRSQALREAT